MLAKSLPASDVVPGGQLGDLEDGISFLVREDVLWALEILEGVQILIGVLQRIGND